MNSKPPKGIVPKRFWLEKRYQDVSNAMKRYVDARWTVPEKWNEEYEWLSEMLFPSPAPPSIEYRGVKVHYLKTLPGPFLHVREEIKFAEMRFDDREFRVGDLLVLKEWQPHTERYTGQEEVRIITHILEGGQFGIEPGYVMLSMAKLFKP